jgi:hypothetical protein
MRNINKILEYPLSDTDIRTILGQNIKIWNYPDLVSVQDFNELFDDEGRCLILYDIQSSTSGHWTCAMIHPDEERIEFFDPYGIKYDSEKNWISEKKLRSFHEKVDYVTNIFRNAMKSGYTVYYNPYKFQEDKPGINTCGRQCCVRILHKDTPLRDYYNFVKSQKMSPDKYVSLITYNIIKK